MAQSIISYCDSKFVLGFWSQVFDTVGTKLKMTVAYRAQEDGQKKCTNRTLEEYLRCVVAPHQDDWDVHLANAVFAINTAVNNSIKRSPFEVDLGYIPRNPLAILADASRQGLRGGRNHTNIETHRELHQVADLMQDFERLIVASDDGNRHNETSDMASQDKGKNTRHEERKQQCLFQWAYLRHQLNPTDEEQRLESV